VQALASMPRFARSYATVLGADMLSEFHRID